METNNISDWKLVNVMLKTLGIETNYSRVAKVLDEISEKVPGYQEINSRLVGSLGCNREKVLDEATSPENVVGSKITKGKLRLRVATYLFSHDKVLDASSTLAHHFKPSAAFLHESDAKKIGVSNGDKVRLYANEIELEAEVVLENRCEAGGVVVPKISDEQGVNGLASLDGKPVWLDIKKV